MRQSLAAACAAALLALTACGSDKPDAAATSTPASTATSVATPSGTPTPTQTPSPTQAPDLASALRAAGQASEDAGSARVAIRSEVPGIGKVTGKGIVRWQGSIAADLTMNMSMQGEKVSIRTLMTEKALYMKMGGALGKQMPTPWLKMSYKDLGKMSGMNLEQLMSQAEQADPSSQLEILAAAGDVRDLGAETVNGQSATHYQGTADIAELAEAQGLDKGTLKAMQELGAESVDYGLWLNGDGLVVKLVQKMTIKGQETTTTTDYSDYGVELNFDLPPASQVTDLAKALPKA